MQDPNHDPQKIRAIVDRDAKLMAGFSLTSKTSIRNEKTLQGLRSRMSGDFRKLVDHESNPNMTNLYNDLAEGFEIVARSHSTYITQVDSKVIPVLDNYQQKVKEVKSMIGTYENKKKALEKQAILFNRTTDETKRNAIQKDYEKAQVDSKQEFFHLTERLKTYEFEKMSDFKQVLLHTLNSEMHYHAKALETLSGLALKIYKIDDEMEAQKMLKDLFGIDAHSHQHQNQNQQQHQHQNQNQ